tara:strand:- start:900 stop:2180 length:1281 start_codon:yes stop_codon:yes gene_type:complete
MPKNNKKKDEDKKSELDSKSKNSNKSFLFNFVDNLQSNSEEETEKIKKIEKKSEKNPAINLLLNNFIKSNKANSTSLINKETRKDKKLRKENKKNLKKIQKEHNEKLKKLQRETKEERKKYLFEKTKFTKIEKTIYEKIAQLEKDKNKILNKFDLGLLEVRSTELKQKVDEYQIELNQLGKEIAINNQLIKDKSNLISNFIKKIPKKSISIYSTLRKEYLLGDKKTFDEISQNQIKFNRPWSNEKVESEIYKMIMSEKYMNQWINIPQDFLHKCPGGCTSSIGKPKRVYRDIEVARNSALDNQYTYFDANCGLGFHNASRKEITLTDKIIQVWKEHFENILQLSKLQLKTSNFINSFEMKEEELKNLQTEILEKEDYKDLDVETFDDQIKSLKETINSDRKIFKEKEYNYLTHGKFVLDGELKKSA